MSTGAGSRTWLHRSTLFILFPCLLPILLLWLADSGIIGDPTRARCGLNLVLILASIRSLAWPRITPSEMRVRFFAGAGLLILLGFAFSHPAASRISGESYSMLGKTELLVLGPLAEEFYFRGLLWRLFEFCLRTREARGRMVWVFTSIAFGLYHLGYWSQGISLQTVPHVAGAVVAGLFFGWLRLKTASVFWPVLAHASANSVILLLR